MMPTPKQRDNPSPENEGEHRQLASLIVKQVIAVLGEPGTLRRMQVQHLWADFYRVNVFVGEDIASAKVAHSYFLTVDGEGAITSSAPKIVKHY
jgi:hypothetical protein